MRLRRASRAIRVGDVTIGGGAPIVVQSMAKTDTRDVAATVAQIEALAECGCQVVRVAVPDREAAAALPAIRRAISIPLLADIHFDHRLALAALKGGVDGLRINPGNIGDRERVAQVVRAAGERQVPIRIGVNAGSLPQAAPGEGGQGTLAERMVAAAMEQIALMEGLGFELIKVALKAFDVATTVEANRAIARQMPYPIHLGITEAGPPQSGIVRSAVGIGILLYEGIGDTVRVSLSGDPCQEVAAAREILKALDMGPPGPVLISCPSCGRAEVDIIGLAAAVEERLKTMDKAIKVAVMGCVVNGPGEARDADVGLACGRGRGVIFRRGEQVRTVEEPDFLSALMAEVEAF